MTHSYQYTRLARCVAIVMSLAILHPRAGFAQVNVSSPGLSAGGTVTGSILFPDGTASAPSIAFSSDSDGSGNGLYRVGANAMAYSSNGIPKMRFGNNTSIGFALSSDLPITWASSTDVTSGSNDLLMYRDAAATLQQGADATGAVVNQTLKACDGITGSNIVGCDYMFSGGVGTGNAAGVQTDLGRTLMGATGTSAQTRTQGLTVCESKTLSNTSATATAVANVALASNSSGAARVTVSVQCNDGTNFDSDLVTSYTSFVNKAGAVTVGTPVTTGTSAANNSGSCTVAPTFVASGASIDIKVTPVITTIVPTTTTAYVNVENLGAGAVTCQ